MATQQEFTLVLPTGLGQQGTRLWFWNWVSPKLRMVECTEGLYWTSLLVKSGKLLKSGLSGNQTFSLTDAGLLTLLKTEKKSKKSKNKFKIFFVYLFGLGTFDTKFVSRNWELWELITCTWRVKCLKIYISLDSVQSGRTCQANLGVWFCSVRKLICPFKFQISYLSFTQNANSLNFELWRLQI